MTFKPTISRLETISELTIARAPLESMARAVGVPVEDLVAWRQRCMNAAANEAALWDRPMPLREPPERRVPMTAARLFEVPEPEQGQGEKLHEWQ
jgi:hypothetical protein